jgi:polyisoprenoid-binding protein YceI
MRFERRYLASILILGASASAGAAERVLTFDPAATSISFHLDATGHDVEGSFALREGEIRFDTETGQATGILSVNAAGAGTGNQKRDKTMHAKVLESPTFPLFVFHAERVEGQLPQSGAAELKLHGRMEIHGGEHPLVMPAHVEIDGDRIKAMSQFAIPYVAWGMHDPSILFLRVAKQVDVTVTAEGQLTTAPETRASASN